MQSHTSPMLPSGVVIKRVSLAFTKSCTLANTFVCVKSAASCALSTVLLKYPVTVTPASFKYFPKEHPTFPAPIIPICMAAPPFKSFGGHALSSDAVSFEYRSSDRLAHIKIFYNIM